MLDKYDILLTCEHATNAVPPDLRPLFPKHILKTHRGFDIGALTLAKKLSRRFKKRLYRATASRLVIDLNRSIHNRRSLFSRYLNPLDSRRKKRILEQLYLPYRKAVEDEIRKKTRRKKPVLHLSVHSFTPVLNGRPRKTDIGLLFDPKRKGERVLCLRWKEILRRKAPQLCVRFNDPYRGTADGFTTSLRRRLPASAYLGIELEINQKFPLGSDERWLKLQQQLIDSLHGLVQG
ncbi:MAG: N-formylglutamate amidohydrolase [Candidatus Omnitrophota bacterium]|nr:N-formylglutamate amidohydrolase [Candidatus Omnitrophota bacterium]